MRGKVIEKIHELMGENKNVYFLTGDLGYHVLEKIESDYPDRFVNCGIAEANMMGVAAGLALSGKKVFVYSIIPFLTMRAYEQIRNDICYHNLDVTLLGVGSGLSYGVLGATHFALEDVSILRSLPNMTVFNPADEVEAVAVVEEISKTSTPTYLRIGKKDEPKIFEAPYSHDIRSGVVMKKGAEITFFTTGTLLQNVVEAANILKEKHNINAAVVHFPTLKPFDKHTAFEYSKHKKAIFVVDEHYETGGLYSAICETVGALGVNSPIINCSVKQEFVKKVGSQEYLRKHFGLDKESLVRKVCANI